MPELIEDLGDGLVLRRAAADDADRLAEFNGRIHAGGGADSPNDRVAEWVRDLLARPHPTFRPEDFTVVEAARGGQIVSSLNLISQRWTYAGVEFGAGRPELVGTHPDFRNRGLVRKQMEIVHQWSRERGERLQAITGIPWYYRQFGYEMGLALAGGRIGYEPNVPKLKDGEAEPYRVRAAADSDLPFIAELYDHGCRRSLVACRRDAALWRYELSGRGERNVNRRELRVIETAAGQAVGWLAHLTFLSEGRLIVIAYEVKPGVSWLAVTPSVIRYLWQTGQAYAAAEDKPHSAFGFGLGAEHPVYLAAHEHLPHERPPYAWYVRVPDLIGFLRHLAPALEQRLAQSVIAGHTGTVNVSFYRSGLSIKIDQGRLSFEPWQPAPDRWGDAALPDHTFLHLLFGHRSLAELKQAFRDCWTETAEARLVLEALFPTQASNIWPID